MSNTEETKPKNNAKPEPLGVFYVCERKDYRKEIHSLERLSKENPDKLKVYQRKKFNLGRTPDVLQLLGVPNAKIEIHHEVLWKVMTDYLNLPPLLKPNGESKGHHNIPPETLIKIPRALNNPIAVFKSETVPDAYVLLIDLKEDNLPIVVSIHLQNGKNTNEQVLEITSAYGKEISGLTKFFNNDLLYIDCQKAQKLSQEYDKKLEQAIIKQIKINSNMQVPLGASIAAVKSYAETPLNRNSHITANQEKTDGDLQVPWRALIAAVPDNCNQPRQNSFVAVREDDNTPFVHKLQEKLKKFISQTIDMVKNIFNKNNNTQATPPQNNQAYNENDLRQWRMENAPLEKDKAYQVFMSIYAERIPPYTPAYEEIAHSTKQEVEEKYKQGKNCTLKQLGEFRQDFFKAFDKSRIKVRQEMDRELKQTPSTLPENITQQNQDDSIKNTTQNNSGCLKR